MIYQQSAGAHAFWLRDHLIEPSLHRITGGGGPVPVEPQVMKVLVALASRPGEVWSRQELLDEAWADTMVNDEALTRAISHLRRHLSDVSSAPQFIETVRKGGYRLVCPVRLVSRGPGEGGGGARDFGSTGGGMGPVTRERSGPRGAAWMRAAGFRLAGLSRHAIMVQIVLASAAAAAFWTLLGLGGEGEPSAVPPVVSALTSYPGEELYPSISPDGSLVAFAWRPAPSEPSDLYVKHVDGASPLRLTENEDQVTFSAWSPDGSELAFVSSSTERSGVFLIPAIGGVPRLLIGSRSRVQGLSWSPSGDRIAFSDRPGSGHPHEIRVVDRATGAVTVLTSPTGPSVGDSRPAYSPDASQLAFARGDAFGNEDLWLVPATGGEAIRLTSDQLRIQGLTWAPGGEEVIFSGSQDGNLGLWRLDLATRRRSWLALPGEQNHHPAAAAKTGTLVYVETRLERNIWQINLEADGGDTLEQRPLIVSTRSESEPQFSPDGTRIAFRSSREGTQELWVAVADGTDLLRLTSLGGAVVGNLRWSPDGERLAFGALSNESAGVWVVDVATARARPLTDTEANAIPVCWSRDGSSVYFASDRESGWQIWRIRLDGSAPERVTRRGGMNAWEGADGRWLYLTKPNQPGLWRMRLEALGRSEAPELVVREFLPHPHGFWQGRVDDILVTSPEEGAIRVSLVNPATGATEIVARVPASDPRSVTVSPDGRTLLYSRIDRDESDLKRLDDPSRPGGRS